MIIATIECGGRIMDSVEAVQHVSAALAFQGQDMERYELLLTEPIPGTPQGVAWGIVFFAP